GNLKRRWLRDLVLTVLRPGRFNFGHELVRAVTEVPDAVRAVHALRLIGLALGLIEVALFEEFSCFGKQPDRIFLVALGAGSLDFHEELVWRIFEQAPLHVGGVGLEGRFLGFVELTVGVVVASLAEQGARITIGFRAFDLTLSRRALIAAVLRLITA